MGKNLAKKGIISEQKILRNSDFLMRVSTLLLPAFNTVNLRGNLVRHYSLALMKGNHMKNFF